MLFYELWLCSYFMFPLFYPVKHFGQPWLLASINSRHWSACFSASFTFSHHSNLFNEKKKIRISVSCMSLFMYHLLIIVCKFGSTKLKTFQSKAARGRGLCERREACWDLPCSSCSCRWRTCWRVAVRRWTALTPVPARRFYAPERQAAALCVTAPSQHAHKASLKGLTMSQRACVCVCVWARVHEASCCRHQQATQTTHLSAPLQLGPHFLNFLNRHKHGLVLKTKICQKKKKVGPRFRATEQVRFSVTVTKNT